MIKDLGKKVAYPKDSGKWHWGHTIAIDPWKKQNYSKKCCNCSQSYMISLNFIWTWIIWKRDTKLRTYTKVSTNLGIIWKDEHSKWSETWWMKHPKRKENKTFKTTFSAGCLTRKKGMCLMLRGKNLGTSAIWESANQ